MSFKTPARKALDKLPVEMKTRLVRAADALAIDPRPRGVKKLHGDENLWRVRVGSYRLVDEIHDEQLIVLIVRVADRKDVYR